MTAQTLCDISPQGPQDNFLRTSAHIAIYGGAAGGGKTFALLMEALRYRNVRGFGAVIFRRNAVQVRNKGGLWDTSYELFPSFGGMPKESIMEWGFASGATVKFNHMEHEKSKLDWQGSQIPFIGFDELTHFTRDQFFYMLSRNDGDKFRHLKYSQDLNLDVTYEDRFLELVVENRKIAVFHGDYQEIVQALVTCGTYDAVFHGHTHKKVNVIPFTKNKIINLNL